MTAPVLRARERVRRAGELLAGQRQPLLMTPGDLRSLLACYQRCLAGLLEVKSSYPGRAAARKGRAHSLAGAAASVQHSASARDGETITITVTVSPAELVRVEVTDDGAVTLPVVGPACGDDEGGRGLQLAGALACAWGCHRQGGRTTTWCELGPEPQHSASARPAAGAYTP